MLKKSTIYLHFENIEKFNSLDDRSCLTDMSPKIKLILNNYIGTLQSIFGNINC